MNEREGQGACQALGKGVYSLVISLLRFVVLALAWALSLTANAAGAGSRCPWQRPGSAPRRFFWREGCTERRCEYSKAVGSHGQPTAQLVKKVFLTSWWTREQAPPPLPPLPVFAEIFQISGRKNCKARIFALENGIFRRSILPCPPYTPPGTIVIREGCGPLELSMSFLTVWAVGSHGQPTAFCAGTV